MVKIEIAKKLNKKIIDVLDKEKKTQLNERTESIERMESKENERLTTCKNRNKWMNTLLPYSTLL